MIVIGLTGGIAAGKSRTSSFLRSLGIQVFDADAEVHDLYEDPLFQARIEEKYGVSGPGLRRKMSSLMASQPDILDSLSEFLGEALANRRDRFLEDNGSRFAVVLDVPLLFEAGWDDVCDITLTISAPESVRRERALSRKGMTEAKLESILSKQFRDGEREARADFVIRNGGKGTIARTTDACRNAASLFRMAVRTINPMGRRTRVVDV